MNENDKKAIIEVLHELEQGYKLGSVDRLTSAFHKEDVSLIGTAVDEVRLGIEEVRYQFQRDIEQTSFRDVSLSEPQIFLHGNVSYVICNLNFVGETIEGEDFAVRGRYSAMLEKYEGNWLIRHIHCSVPDFDISEGDSIPRI